MRDLEAIALLQDPARRSLYEYVVAAGREVSRNDAAQAVGLQRTLAAFHLDRLAGAGLLDIAYRRLGPRSGPGAGRPAKLYRRAAAERMVAVPPRDYSRAAQILAEAIERTGTEAVLYDAARKQGITDGRAVGQHSAEHGGRAVGEESPEQGSRALAKRPSASASSRLGDDVVGYLTERGYEPYAEGATIRLRNCPFHSVAQEFPVVACGMNLALLEGMLSGASLADRHEAQLDPRPGECCVALVSKTNLD